MTESKKRNFKFGAVVVGIILIAWLASLKNAIGVDNGTGFWGSLTAPAATPDPDYVMPEKESDRLDILILGIRGKDEESSADTGPLLTDSINILSYNKKTKAASLVSLPRDLKVMIHEGRYEKLNEVYEYGYYHSSSPLSFVKNRISEITGVYIDKVIVFNFSSFKDIVDSLDGIDITLAKEFKESQQWGYEFYLPAGQNHLDGQTALYYARSRYSTNDFDRSQRQQQIMLAIKDKIMALDFLGDPIKTFNVFNTIRKDIMTDIGIQDINQFLDLARSADFSKMRRYVISNANLVYDTKDEKGLYILLPYGGNFDNIKALFQNILAGKPLPTSAPSQTP